MTDPRDDIPIEALSNEIYERVIEFLAALAPPALENVDDIEKELTAAINCACDDHCWNFNPA